MHIVCDEDIHLQLAYNIGNSLVNRAESIGIGFNLGGRKHFVQCFSSVQRVKEQVLEMKMVLIRAVRYLLGILVEIHLWSKRTMLFATHADSLAQHLIIPVIYVLSPHPRCIYIYELKYLV